MMRLQDAHAWLLGARAVGELSVAIARVHTDTRSLLPGDLFVALKGERFDANSLLAQARAAGAVAAIAHGGLGQAGLPGYEVPDTRAALAQLARGWRAQFSLPLIAVTGSNGKTTLTHMLAAILQAWQPGAALATQGNLNNDIGVPLTLLRLRASHRAAVVELGMNHIGEIAQLAALAQPTLAVVNNAQREHQEFMGSVQAVAHENGAVLAALPASGVAVFPAHDAHTPLWRALAGERACLSFAIDAPADISGHAQWQGQAWQVQVRTPGAALAFRLAAAGRHNVHNALAAVASAWGAGVSAQAIVDGLQAFTPVKGRSQRFDYQPRAGHTVTVVDDSYNANPDSVRAAIDMLSGLSGPRLLVLGDMGEVGQQGPEFHAEVGAYARASGIDQLYTLGSLSLHAQAAFGGGRHFDDMPALQAQVLADAGQCASILVKGSRFMRMERITQALAAATPLQKADSHAA